MAERKTGNFASLSLYLTYINCHNGKRRRQCIDPAGCRLLAKEGQTISLLTMCSSRTSHLPGAMEKKVQQKMKQMR